MKKESQEQLFIKYPKLFRQKDLGMMQTAMCWGVDTGEGWRWLIDNLCEEIQSYIDNNKIPQVEAVQVKEKWGRLAFYIDGGDDYIFGLIGLAEHLSEKICEECGSNSGDVTCGGKSWVRTLCKDCREVYNKKREEI